MGMSGTGKSTLAHEIATHFDMTFLDADSLYSAKDIRHMSQGLPLTDAQRAPWVQRICRKLRQKELQGQSCVLAYSGLKRKHRQSIISSYSTAVGILLEADREVVAQRLQARVGHFMPPQLLDSQIASVEPVNDSEAENLTLLTLNAAESLEQVVLKSVEFVGQCQQSTS